MMVRPGRWRLPRQTTEPDGEGHDIFAARTCPMPRVLPPGRGHRPPACPQDGQAPPRRPAGPRPQDRHLSDGVGEHASSHLALLEKFYPSLLEWP
jgi:hypothetical protein